MIVFQVLTPGLPSETLAMNIYSVFPERFLGFVISALLVYDATFVGASSNSIGLKNPTISSSSEAQSNRAKFGALSGLFLVLLLSTVLDQNFLSVNDGSGLDFTFRTQALKARRILGAIGCILGHSNEEAANLHTQYVLIRLFAVLGGRILVSASDLRVFYLALELQSLALYVLAASVRGSAYSTEAGLKYFRLGAFASGLFLLGASFIYSSLGSTQYSEISLLLNPSLSSTTAFEGIQNTVYVGFGLILSAIRFKLAVVPFHRWSPDVIEGAPASSSRFFATVTKVAAFGALIQLVYGPFYPVWVNRLDSIVIRSALSMTVAALAALGQRRRKRFLAYSGIGHRGFILRGVASGTAEGLQASLRYLSIYLIGTIGTWTAVVSSGTRYFTDLGGIGRYNPGIAIVFAISRFSRAGIPPRAGFYAKRSVLFSALETSNYRLVTIAVLASVVGAFYYLRIIKIRYFEPARNFSSGSSKISFGAAWTRAISSYITVALLFNPGILTSLTNLAISR